MTLTAGTGVLTFAGTSGTQVITSNAKTMDFPLTVSNNGSGTVQLADALTLGVTRTLTLTIGTLDLNGKTLTTGLFSSSNSNTRTLAFGTGNIICNAAGGSLWNTGTVTGLTVTGTPTVNISNSGAVATTVATGAFTEANNISFNFTTGTYALTFLATAGYTAKNVNFTGFSGSWSIGTAASIIYGNLTLTNTMSVGGTGSLTFGATSGTQVFTSNTLTTRDVAFPININGIGGTVQLADSLRISSNLTLTNGTFDGNNVGIGMTGAGVFTMTTGSVSMKGVTTNGGFALALTQASGTLTQIGNNTVRAYTLTSGTLSLGSYAFNCETFASSNANTRTIAFDTGNIVCTVGGGTIWTTATVTGLTVTGTPVVNISYSGGLNTTVASGALTEANSISFNFTTGAYVLTFLGTASYSCKNANFTGFAGVWAATSTGVIYGNLTLATGMTLTASASVMTFSGTSGTQVITSNAKTIDFPVTFNGIGGTFQLADALIVGATRTFSINNGTFDGNNKTISGAALLASNLAGGTPTIKNISTAIQFTLTNATLLQGGPNTVGAFLYSSGNLNISNYQLTCSTYTATAGVVRTITCGTGNITVINTAGGTICNVSGASLTRVGNVVINISNNSSNATVVGTGTFTETNAFSFNFIDGNYLLTFLTGNSTQAFNVDFTGFSGTFNTGITGTAFIYGNLTLSSSPGFIMSAGGSNVALAFSATSGVQTVTSNGASFGRPLNVNGVGGTVRLADAMLMVSTQGFTHTNGTLDLNGKTLTVGTTYATAAGTQNITFNGGTLVCPAVTTTAFNNAAPTNFTTTAGTGTGKISMTGATAKTFVGGGATYNCTLSNDGAGALTVSGSNTFTTIANGVQPTAFTFTAATTQTVTNWNVSGTAGNLVTITSGTAGVPALLSKASGTVSSNYLSLKDSTATGGAAWYAGANSTNVSGNLGWIFTAPPATSAGSFFFMFS
jgi:hypothetical protein